jgi:ABC-type glycerol-3-phosphate transport system substrate-binding protein
MKKSIIGVFFIILVLVSIGAVCSKSGKVPAKFDLVYWSPEHNEDDIAAAISGFEAMYPYVDVEYKKYNYDEYEEMLINSWAKGQGPDVFSLPNTHTNKYYDLIAPLPATVSVTTVETKSTFGKKETIVNTVNQRCLSVAEMKNQFVDTVYSDAVFVHKGEKETTEKEKIFGIPLSTDTLALFYNKDLLNQAGITTPATNWQDIVEHTKLLTKIDKENNLIQSGIALGTANNIDNYFDILSVLMMQYGAQMADENNRVTFDQELEGERRIPGQQALDFYAKFAMPDWESYTWNSGQNSALEAFAGGQAGYYIGYYYNLEQIKQLAPNLNFDIATLPQINAGNKKNYPSYWLESVSINSTHQDMAWAFVQYLTGKENSEKYLASALKPAARRELISAQEENYELAIFAEQALTAQSWYHGKSPDEAKSLFATMIDQAVENTLPIADIVGNAARKIELTMQL